jgi:hypothetical protein
VQKIPPVTLQVWEESIRSDHTGEVLRADFNLTQTHVREIVIRAQERGDIDESLDPLSVAQTMVSLVVGQIVQRATGTVVDAEKYEEATRSLVTGRLWNTTPANQEPATNPI